MIPCSSCFPRALLIAALWLPPDGGAATDTPEVVRARRVEAVTGTPGLAAFWDFVQRESAPPGRFTAHAPPGAGNDYPLDARNYVRESWGRGREAAYDDFPMLGRGPFGQAVRIRRETDPDFRPLLEVPRARLQDSGLDVKGPGQSVSVLVWAIRESGNHALAGIWHEGTDLWQPAATPVVRVERGQRQYGLFAGLSRDGAALGHVSENGAASFGDIYARNHAITADRAAAISADAPAAELDRHWAVFAFTFDNARDECTAYLNGVASECWLEDVRHKAPWLWNAWHQGHGSPAGPSFNPPEDKPLAVRVTRETEEERVELHEFPYTRVLVTLRKRPGAAPEETSRELDAVRLNPWWFPHDLYTPPDDGSGGPFTIGRVIHSGRGVGFTGWIGGVAVFRRALAPDEIARLSAIGRDPVLAPAAPVSAQRRGSHSSSSLAK